MNAQDLQSQNNNRAEMINRLIAFCSDNGLSYNYTQVLFTIPLPGAEPMPTATELTTKKNRREKFNIDNWGPKGYWEGEEPDPEQPLDEGQPPRSQI